MSSIVWLEGEQAKFRSGLFPEEMSYYRHGGILPYVLRQLVGRERA